MIGLAVLTVILTCGGLIFFFRALNARNVAMMKAMSNRLSDLEAIMTNGSGPALQATPPVPAPAPVAEPVIQPSAVPGPASALAGAGWTSRERAMMDNMNKNRKTLGEFIEQHAEDGRSISEAMAGDNSFADFPDPIELNRELSKLLGAVTRLNDSFMQDFKEIDRKDPAKNSRRLPWPLSIFQRDLRNRAIGILHKIVENQALLEKMFHVYKQEREAFSNSGHGKARAKRMLLLNHELALMIEGTGYRLDKIAASISRLRRAVPV